MQASLPVDISQGLRLLPSFSLADSVCDPGTVQFMLLRLLCLRLCWECALNLKGTALGVQSLTDYVLS